MRPDSILILFSGGIDSTACIHYFLSLGYKVRSLFIDYGQIVAQREYRSALQIANYYKIDLDYVKIDLGRDFKKGEVLGRNLTFILIALMKYQNLSGIISLGIHSGVAYYDTTECFVNDAQNILNKFTDGTLQLNCPFIKWQKPLIFEYCKEHNLPIHLTYSCEEGIHQECGTCLSCLDRKALACMLQDVK